MSTNFTEIAKRHLGPPVNIEAIIRGMGIELDKKADLDEEIAGQLAKLPDGKFKISINKSDTYYRQRFTMAHELGHYLLHAHLIGDGVDDSKAYRSVPTGQFYNEAITRLEETQANQFASRLLLPKSVVTKLARVGATIKDISVQLQASIPATQIRLSALGYTVADNTIVAVPPETDA
ncbi:ImmA/IrrE family metallo-endopeptidase [Kaistia adipata]|uniref:ImmA/IrrE family metallo-endopeptidase n=1 Tax=Kaistia adipata TaxID=166954 RepID=UPI0009FF0AC3|nr:ImmA/IrrE family metallo-endopeptidase [Kaistia adipata]